MSEDVILDRVPDGVDPRRPITLGVKVAALLHILGLDGPVQWDHRPPLWLRKWNATRGDTVPPANDPRFLVPLSVKAHDIVTNGRGGEKRITTAGSDTHARAKGGRLSTQQAEFRAALLRKEAGEPKPPSRWPSRPLRSRPMRQERSR